MSREDQILEVLFNCLEQFSRFNIEYSLIGHDGHTPLIQYLCENSIFRTPQAIYDSYLESKGEICLANIDEASLGCLDPYKYYRDDFKKYRLYITNLKQPYFLARNPVGEFSDPYLKDKSWNKRVSTKPRIAVCHSFKNDGIEQILNFLDRQQSQFEIDFYTSYELDTPLEFSSVSICSKCKNPELLLDNTQAAIFYGPMPNQTSIMTSMRAVKIPKIVLWKNKINLDHIGVDNLSYFNSENLESLLQHINFEKEKLCPRK